MKQESGYHNPDSLFCRKTSNEQEYVIKPIAFLK